jgi:hypothetical protein
MLTRSVADHSMAFDLPGPQDDSFGPVVGLPLNSALRGVVVGIATRQPAGCKKEAVR